MLVMERTITMHAINVDKYIIIVVVASSVKEEEEGFITTAVGVADLLFVTRLRHSVPFSEK